MKKDFKVAQIVPRSCLEAVSGNHYHMCLAHLVYDEKMDWSGTSNRKYTKFYQRMSDIGKYVMMDNGAAEGSQLMDDELIDVYGIIRPTEIVVPDVISDCDRTIAKVDKFVRKYSDLPYKFMGVPQGKSLVDWCECAAHMIRCERINTIGISKFLNITTGDPLVRYYAAAAVESLAQQYGRDDIEIHLLGCDEGPAIIRCIQSMVPIVRGCDSAFAYIAAQAGEKITKRTKRPTGEIDFLHGTYQTGLAERLAEMETECGVDDNKDGTLWRDE